MPQTSRQGQPLDVVLATQRPTETAPPVSALELDLLFHCFAQCPPFFAEARTALREYHFDPGSELAYALLLRAMSTVTDKIGPPNGEILAIAMMDLLQPMAGSLAADFVDSIIRQDEQGLLWMISNVPIDQTTLTYGRQTLQKFLHERTVVFPLRRLLAHGSNGHYSVEIPNILAAVQNQIGAIASLQTVPRVVALEYGAPIHRPAQVFKPMGIPFFDNVLEGQRVGDVNGIIGVIGAGKTTTGVHVAVASARQSYIEASRDAKVPELTIFITAEESGEKVLPRFQSAAFQIPHKKLATMQDWSILTTQNNLDPYERGLFGEDNMTSESDRYYQNYPWFRDCLEIFDMSGSQAYPHAGEGFTPELMANIEAVLRARNNQPLRTVVIDWAGILVQRHMDANGVSEDKLRHYLTKFINQCRRQIAEKFGCTVWVLHQIKGQLITSAPTKLFQHGDAAEASAFAAELAVCGCIGVPDKDTGCRFLNWSKVRYKPGEEVPPIIIKIHRHFSAIEDVSMRYGLNDAGTKFALNSDRAMIHGAAVRQGPLSAGPPGLRRSTDPDPSDALGTQN